MVLYIRSQDGNRIEKMRHIAYEPILEFCYDTGESIELNTGKILVNDSVMGEYTKEQAMEILDYIFDLLRPIYKDEIDTKIYQLPNFEEENK